MKVRIEFDANDFVKMITDFFQTAGYSIYESELQRISSLFQVAFKSGFQVEVLPSESPSIDEDNPLTAPVELVTEPQEDIDDPPFLTKSQVLNPAHSDDMPEIKKILNISRRLEQGSKSE